MIEGVFFDGDQTLWDFQTLMRRALAATLDHLRQLRPGPGTDRLTVESLVADRAAAEDDAVATGMSLEDLRLAAFACTAMRIGPPDQQLAATLNDYYRERRFIDVDLFDDVLPVLTDLRTKMPLGLLSNGNGYPERSGLTGVFTVVVFSDDHGMRKPDRRLFDIAAQRIAIPPDRLVMVGDSLTHDVAGSQKAGWHGFWLISRRKRIQRRCTSGRRTGEPARASRSPGVHRLKRARDFAVIGKSAQFAA